MRNIAIVLLVGFVLMFSGGCKAGPDREQARRIKEKSEMVQQGIQERAKKGEDVSAVLKIMKGVKPYAEKGDFDGAEARIDEALAILNGQEPPATEDAGGSRNARLTAEGEKATKEFIEGPYQRIKIIGDSPKNGIFDPSMEYGPDGTGWLAYSAVFGDDKPFGPYVQTHVAKSTDKGKTWTYAGKINTSTKGEFKYRNGDNVKGYWNNEVSTLLYDAGDPGKEWKIFSHRLLFITQGKNKGGAHNALPSSTVSYRHAPHPTGPWSEPTLLFYGKALPPKFAKDNNAQVNLNKLHRDLRKHVVYSELGSVVVDGTIYLSMTGLVKDGPDKIILLASDDHAKTWRYVGALLERKDARALGYHGFDGSSLVKIKDRHYMFAAPMSGGGEPPAYNGTMIIEIEDISKARVKRDKKGGVLADYYIEPNMSIWSGNGGGTADYDEQNTAGGIVYPQVNMGDLPDMFQIFSTSQNIQ